MSLLNAENRSDEVKDIADRFDLDNITHPDARQVGMAYGRLAQEMIMRLHKDDGELIRVLEALHDARSVAIRAVLPEPRRAQFEGNDKRPEKETETRKTPSRPRTKTAAGS